MINPAAIIHPVETHTGAKITAIASRDISAAQKSAKQYSIEKAYGSYEELLADSEIDAVYISVPNSLHAGTSLHSQRICLTTANMGRMGHQIHGSWQACSH